MKQSRICPKCNGRDIIIADGYVGTYGSGNNIMTGFTIFSAVPVDRYICCDCGFTEEWIRKSDIEKLKSSGKLHR